MRPISTLCPKHPKAACISGSLRGSSLPPRGLRRRSSYIALSFVILAASASRLVAADFYISPTGDDSNPGTLTAPWLRLAAAVQRSQPGDTVYLRGGTYNEGEIWIQQKAWGGAPGKIKIVRNVPGETPSLGGPRRLINQADWMRFEGLTFRLPYIFDNSTADHVEVRNCHFEGPQPDYGAISFAGNHGVIEGNFIQIVGDSNNTLDHGIYLLHGTDNVIRGNVVLGATGYGIHIYDEHKSEDLPGFVRRFDRIRVEQNYVAGSRHRSGMIAIVSETASMSNVVIRANVLAQNNHNGVMVGNSHGVRIEENTFYNNGRQGVFLYSSAAAVSVHRNLFVHTSSAACTEFCSWFEEKHIGLEGARGELIVDDNFYFPASIPSDGPPDLHLVTGDPGFISPSDHDLRLASLSAACDNASPPGHFGALPCGDALLLSVVQLDTEHGLLRLRALGPPGTRLSLQLRPSISARETSPWRDIADGNVSPIGVFWAVPLVAESPSAKFYRVRSL